MIIKFFVQSTFIHGLQYKSNEWQIYLAQMTSNNGHKTYVFYQLVIILWCVYIVILSKTHTKNTYLGLKNWLQDQNNKQSQPLYDRYKL